MLIWSPSTDGGVGEAVCDVMSWSESLHGSAELVSVMSGDASIKRLFGSGKLCHLPLGLDRGLSLGPRGCRRAAEWLGKICTVYDRCSLWPEQVSVC